MTVALSICPRCHGRTILWEVPVTKLQVVQQYPTLHGFAERMEGTDETHGTASVRCWECNGKGIVYNASAP